MQPKAHLLKTFATPLAEVENLNADMHERHSDSMSLRLAGMVSSFTVKISKKTQKPFGIMLLEDLDSSCEIMLYERTLNALKESGIELATGSEVIMEVTARRNDEGDRPRLAVEKLYMLDEAPEKYSAELYLHIYEKDLKPDTLKNLAALCRSRQVPENGTRTILCLVNDRETVFVESGLKGLRVDMGMLKKVENLLGMKNYRIKPKEVAPPPRVWSRPPAPAADK